MKPKCTIFNGWNGPECDKPAISLNDYGGFQCEFHDSIPRCAQNKIGPIAPISKDDSNTEELLQKAYDEYLKTEQLKSHKINGKIIIAAHNVPQSMLRGNNK